MCFRAKSKITKITAKIFSYRSVISSSHILHSRSSLDNATDKIRSCEKRLCDDTRVFSITLLKLFSSRCWYLISAEIFEPQRTLVRFTWLSIERNLSRSIIHLLSLYLFLLRRTHVSSKSISQTVARASCLLTYVCCHEAPLRNETHTCDII